MDDNKGKSHKGFKIFILLLLIVVLFFSNDKNQAKFIQAYKSLTIREKTLEEIKSINLDTNIDEIGLFDKDIALWGNNKLSIKDIGGNLLLEKQFNFVNPHIVFGQKSSYIMDKSSGDIYIIDKKGETLERINLDRQINNMLVDEDNIIVHTKDEDEENLIFFSSEGVFLRIHPIEDKDILTYDIDSSNDRYLVSHLNIEDQLISEVSIYSINGELIDRVQIPNEIIIFTEFLDEDLIALTDKCLYYINDSKIHWKKTFSNIKDVILKDDSIYILYGENLEEIDFQGRTKERFSIGKDYNRIKDFEDYILVIADDNLLGIQGDREILNYKHDSFIDDIIINKNYLAIIDEGSLNLFKVNNK